MGVGAAVIAHARCGSMGAISTHRRPVIRGAQRFDHGCRDPNHLSGGGSGDAFRGYEGGGATAAMPMGERGKAAWKEAMGQEAGSETKGFVGMVLGRRRKANGFHTA